VVLDLGFVNVRVAGTPTGIRKGTGNNMAVGITPDTNDENPYISVTEFKNAPTSLDINTLVIGGNQSAQDAELANVIMRASSYLNEYLNQNLVASRYTEQQRVRINNQGYIALHPNNSPIISLEAFNYGTTPNNLQALTDCSQTWFESQQLIIPLSNMAATYSSAGPLSFGAAAPRQPMYTNYTYVSGYVNTYIASASAGASTLTVTKALGIVPNQVLRIYDGELSELVTVSPNYVYGSTTVPLTSGLVSNHLAGATIGNLPSAVKQACILATTAFLRIRGDKSNTMSITTRAQGSEIPGATRYGSDLQLALDMVNLYRRVR
jgi:hypothetical protein